jgi:ATP-binding cassette subfamily F protein uup
VGPAVRPAANCADESNRYEGPLAQPPAKPRRISFNDRRALEMLPARIAELQTQITGLNVVLADPDLYARDPGRVCGYITGACHRA